VKTPRQQNRLLLYELETVLSWFIGSPSAVSLTDGPQNDEWCVLLIATMTGEVFTPLRE
jgi:hypothetical protein